MNDKPSTIIDHLNELRTRLIRSFYALLAASLIGLYFCKDIFALLQIPMQRAMPEGSFFIATTPFESYATFFKIAFLAGIFIASPFLFYQLWQFVVPALKEKEKRLILPFAMASAFLFVGGALFGYFVVFPAGFYYVNLVLEGTAIKLLPKMSDYLNVATSLLLAFGISFELPLVIILLGKLGLLDTAKIRHYRRYVIIVIFITAGVLTPGPDVLSQLLLALPLCLLYELGGAGVWMMEKRKVASPA